MDKKKTLDDLTVKFEYATHDEDTQIVHALYKYNGVANALQKKLNSGKTLTPAEKTDIETLSEMKELVSELTNALNNDKHIDKNMAMYFVEDMKNINYPE